jgi:hypothetical protein
LFVIGFDGCARRRAFATPIAYLECTGVARNELDEPAESVASRSFWGTVIPFQLPYRFFHFGEAGARFGLFIAVLLQHCRDPRLQLETCSETSSACSTRAQGSPLGKAEAEAGDCSLV